MNQSQPDRRTCIVVPCFNEEARLNVAAIEDYVAGAPGVNFLFVNDGSRDGTLGVLNRLAERHPARIRVLHLSENQGKAEAVRRGMQTAMAERQFDYAGYWDADLATPLDAIRSFVETLDRLPDVEIVFGARVALLGRQIQRRAIRHYLGRLFATAASLVLALPIYDTQCGAKLFRVDDACASLFEAPFGSRWIFDVEIVARYLRTIANTAGKSSAKVGIYEMPLDRWEDIGASNVRGADFIRAIGEMAAIYRTYRLTDERESLLRLVTAPFVRYAAAGVLGTLLHYVVLTAAVEMAHVAPMAATICGGAVGAGVNYLLNYHVTFHSTRPHRETLPRFLFVAAIGMTLDGILVSLATRYGVVHYLFAQVLATVIVLGMGYFANRSWTFARPR